MNHPVRISSIVAFSRTSVTKVRKSNAGLTRPKTIIKRRIKPMSQRRGFSTNSGSTLSPAMVTSGKSVRRLISRICLPASDASAREGSNPAGDPESALRALDVAEDKMTPKIVTGLRCWWEGRARLRGEAGALASQVARDGKRRLLASAQFHGRKSQFLGSGSRRVTGMFLLRRRAYETARDPFTERRP